MSKTKTIQIAFNMEDPFQKKLYHYFKSQAKNASLYGKMLIQQDMEKNVVEHDNANLHEPEIVRVANYLDQEISINMDGAFKLK